MAALSLGTTDIVPNVPLTRAARSALSGAAADAAAAAASEPGRGGVGGGCHALGGRGEMTWVALFEDDLFVATRPHLAAARLRSALQQVLLIYY